MTPVQILHELEDLRLKIPPGTGYDERDELVSCDGECHAKEHPATFEELYSAWQHWLFHCHLNGCSHGN